MKKKKLEPAPAPKRKVFVIEIENGVPVPPARNAKQQGASRTWPLASMAVGESFLVPVDCRSRVQMQKLVIGAKRAMKEQGLSRDFAVRFFHTLRGTRIYRTK